MYTRKWIKNIFDHFDWKALEDAEKDVLKGGTEKHIRILNVVLFFLPFQIILAVLAPEIMALLTAASFIALMLGSAWYAISFQNVSEAQLEVGLADYITEKMFRAFFLAFNVLPIGMLVFMVKTLIPELATTIPTVETIPLWLRLILLAGNIRWVTIVWVDVIKASISYDGADSLLGDGFPRLMRGAVTTAAHLPILKEILEEMKKGK